MIAKADQPEHTLSLLQRLVGRIELEPCSNPDLDGNCWTWKGALNSKGYPIIKAWRKAECAHRVSHLLFVGPIPDGYHVNHKCLNPRCVNPKHLNAVPPELNRHLQTLGVGDMPPF